MIITNHGENRVRKRIGVSKKVVEGLFEKALELGIEHSDTKGRLNKYFTYLYFHNKTANNIRIYSDYVFICQNKKLITCFKIPNEHLKAARKLASKKNS